MVGHTRSGMFKTGRACQIMNLFFIFLCLLIMSCGGTSDRHDKIKPLPEKDFSEEANGGNLKRPPDAVTQQSHNPKPTILDDYQLPEKHSSPLAQTTPNKDTLVNPKKIDTPSTPVTAIPSVSTFDSIESFQDLIKVQKYLMAKSKGREAEQIRLFMMYILNRDFLKADETYRALQNTPHDDLTELAAAYLYSMLGEHEKSETKLKDITDKWKRAPDFQIINCLLCEKVKSYRIYTESRSHTVTPGEKLLLYVEPSGFELKKSGTSRILNLRYDWELFDERDVNIPVLLWERAKQSDKEDHKEFKGDITEFHVNFLLPLPKNLTSGHYYIKVSITDLNSGKTATGKIAFTVVS